MSVSHRPMLGESGYERQEHDAYWTPAWCTEELATQIQLREHLWEPACGLGHITNILKRTRRVFSSDLIYRPDADVVHSVRNFLEEEEAPEGVRGIVTNPPYEHAEEFVRHAVRLMAPRAGQVAMLLRNEFDSASSRVDLFARPPFFCKLVLTRRPRWSEHKKASPRHNFAWFIFDHAQSGQPVLKYQARRA